MGSICVGIGSHMDTVISMLGEKCFSQVMFCNAHYSLSIPDGKAEMSMAEKTVLALKYSPSMSL